MAALQYANLTIPPAGSLNAAAAGSAGRQLAAAGSRSAVPIIYGEDRIGALLLNVLPAAAGSGTLLVQCLWGFACDSVLDVRFNDQALPAGATVTTYTGSQATADAALVSAFAAQSITYADTLDGYAFSVVALPMRAVEGQLSISARVRGRKLYDPRKDSTQPGGAGLHRANNPATWEWSDNPALALGDFIASATYGCGRAVNWLAAMTAANACDAMIGSPAEKRRMLGVSFLQPAPVAQIADALLAYAGCWLVPGAAGIRLVPDADAAPVASFDHSAGQIGQIGALQLRDLGDVPTAVEVLYTDTRAFPWREGSALAQLAGAGSTRPWRLSQVRLPGIQRHSQAMREATERLNKLTLQQLATTVDVFDEGMRVEEGDLIALTHPVGLTARAFRVTAALMSGPGRWRLALVEHNAGVYSDAVVSPPTLNAPGNFAPQGTPGAVAGLSGTVAQGIITWAWTAPTEPDTETRIRLGGTDWASAAPLWIGRGSGYLQRVTATGGYTLRARHAVPDGAGGWLESATVSAVTVNVAAGDLVQSEPGAPGLTQALAELYQWGSASQPGNPSGNSTWTWATAAHSAYTGGNGWGPSVGSNPGTAGARLWVARKPVSAAVGTVSTSVDWTGGYTIFAAGINGNQGPTGGTGSAGAAGIKAATPTVWRWDTSTPTVSGSATYTWAAADTGLVPSGWASAPGAGSAGQTLYGASVQLVDAAGSATTAIDWSTASVSARGYAGTNGTNGGAGAQGLQGVSARRAYVLTTAASLGSGSVNSTGINSLPAAGSFGATGWAATPATPAAGQTLYQSDGLYAPATDTVTWTTPYISALKVGNLAALAVNTGALTVDGNITVASGGQVASSNYAAGSAGWALTPTGAEFPAAAIRGQITAAQVNTNGLTIRDGSGNVIVGAGASVDPSGFLAVPGGWLNSNQQWTQVSGRPSDSAIRNNLIDLSWWTADAAIPWVVNDEYNYMHTTENAGVPGPRGGSDVVWYSGETTGNGDAGGGWNNSPLGATLDPAQTYRFAVPIRRIDGTGSAYWGPGQTLVCDLNTSTASSNPYFCVSSALQTGRWYLFVGYLFPVGSTGNTHAGAGIYDCTTGALVVAGNNFNQRAGYTDPYHRAYQYYASLGAHQVFGRPMVNLVDGTEPSLREYFEAGAVLNSALVPSITAAQDSANSALSQLTGKLNKSAADILVGPINLQAANALYIGTANDGLYMGSTGIVGRKAGATTFAVDAAGNATFAGALSAATGSFAGSVSVNEATYATGTGVWLGMEGGVAKFRVGSTDQYIRWTGTALELKLNAFTASVPGGDISSPSGVNGSRTYGNRTVSASGGTLPYTYSFSMGSAIDDQGISALGKVGFTTSATPGQVYVYGNGSNTILSGSVQCVVTDSQGRTASTAISFSGTHGTPP